MQKKKFRVIGTLMKTIKVDKESFQYVKGLETKKRLNALCHDFVGCKLLAKDFSCDKNVGNGSL